MSSTMPRWWRSWELLAPRLAMAADGQYVLPHRIFNQLQSEGFAIGRLRSWQPSQKEGRRVQAAIRLVQLALEEPSYYLPQRKGHLAQQLSGAGVWADLRHLAEAYIDGTRGLSRKNETADGDFGEAGRGGSTVPINSVSANNVLRPSVKAVENQRKINPTRSQESGGAEDLFFVEPPIRALSGLRRFFEDANEITVYIDEAWAGPGTQIGADEGVIAAVVCKGVPEAVFNDLPLISTHSYQRPNSSNLAIRNLLTCSSCKPFIFPIRMAQKDQIAQKHYDIILQHAVRLLCGWLIRPKKITHISILCERINERTGGTNGIDFIRGGWLVSPERFENWKLNIVGWTEKNVGYIPYADLLAHLTLGHTDASVSLGKVANFKQLPGYIPFSLDLVPRLERLAHLESVANVEDVIHIAMDTGNSPFGQVVMLDLAERLKLRIDLQQRILEALEQRYRSKTKELRTLRQAFSAVRRLLPALPPEAHPRMRLLWYLLALQDANHDGDPQRIRTTADDYLRERERLKLSDRELCADADLNLAVHYADRFAFSHAEVTINDWVDDPLFAALSQILQGRFFSALGQYRAMQNDSEAADVLFLEALRLFSDAPVSADERRGELEQTRIYRAINAIDGGLQVAPQALADVFGVITPELAARFAADGSTQEQYRHHLLLRAFSLRSELSEACESYLAARALWKQGNSQHPWPGIHGYRGFLLWNREEIDEALSQMSLDAFDQAIELATQPHHGPTVKLIGAMWATIASCCFSNCGYEDSARKLIAAANILPDANLAIATLESVLSGPSSARIGDALTALPFNYR